MIDPRRAFKNEGLRSLAEAAKVSDVAKIDQLVRAGVSVNGVGEEGIRPLHWSLMGKNELGLRRLLELGADPNAELAIGRSPVYMAAALESPKFLELLLRYGGNPNGRSSSSGEDVALHKALLNGRMENIKVLLKAGANPDAKSVNIPILITSLDLRNWEAAIVLLRAGASVQGKTGEMVGETICDRPPRRSSSTYRAYEEVVNLVLQKGVKLPCHPLDSAQR